MTSSSSWSPPQRLGAITITKCDHLGESIISYPGQVTFCDDDCIVMRCIWRMPAAYRFASFSLTDGDILIETYYRDRWYNVFAAYNAAGVLKGWYCNITYPPLLQPTSIRWPDLALDLLILPDYRCHILDQSEFASLPLSNVERSQARDALAELQSLARTRRWPFRGAS